MAKNKKISVPLKNKYDSDPKFHINNPKMSAEELIEAHLNDEEKEILLERIRNKNLQSYIIGFRCFEKINIFQSFYSFEKKPR